MVDRIGSGGNLAREAILAAMKTQAQTAQRIQEAAESITGAQPARSQAAEPPETGFAQQVRASLGEVQTEIQKAQELPVDLVVGKIEDFHEVAMQIKKADLSFKFAMEIRNKLIDAYREVMRMSV